MYKIKIEKCPAIEIYYPSCYEDISDLGVEDFMKTADYFLYSTSMVIYNSALPTTNNYFVIAFNKYWFGGIYVDCFLSNGEEVNLESICEEFLFFHNLDLHEFIDRIPYPEAGVSLFDDFL